MNIERLKTLSYMLENIETLFPDAGGFDLSSFRQEYFDYTTYKINNGCGTVACACGYAAMYKPFVAQGFHLAGKSCKTVEFEGQKSWEAIFNFFDIEAEHAYWMFSTTEYSWSKVNPLEVKRRVDALISGNFDTDDMDFGRDQ